MHLDGARVWNAIAHLDTPLATYVKDFNTVSVCMSKGMGAPIGSLLCGSQKDIDRAKTLRKIAGGGMRQTGILAACALVSLEEDWQAKLKKDNDNCQWMGFEVAEIPGVEFDPETVQTNILRFTLTDALMKKKGFKNRYFDLVG
jgi:threonine aldolase